MIVAQTMPPAMRSHLLALLELGYPAGAPQTRLAEASSAAIAWQVQSMLDDWVDPPAIANDNGWRTHFLTLNDAAVKAAIKGGARHIPGLAIRNEPKVGIR